MRKEIRDLFRGWYIGESVYSDWVMKNSPKHAIIQKKESFLYYQKCPFIGVLTGAKYFYTGKVEYYERDGVSSVTTAPKQIIFLIRTAIMEEEIMVFPEDLHHSSVEYVIPIFQSTWSLERKRLLSSKMKTWPRDARGRWT